MRFEVGPDCAGVRLDQFLSQRAADASRAQVQAWIRGGRVRVAAREERKIARRLRAGEVVECSPTSRPALRAVPEDLPVDVVYEDDHLAVVDKAAGMPVHAGGGVADGTLVNALLFRLRTLSGVPGELRPGIVHRLDRHTTGLLVVAKRDPCHRHLQRQFQRRTVAKLYWAAVEGALPADPRGDPAWLRHGRPVMREGLWWLRLDGPIGRDRRNRVRMAVTRRGRDAVSDVRRLRGAARHALAEVRIHTGRTHQVRVHLASAGHPVVGDTLYGAPAGTGPDRYLLHARRLEFDHPHTGERMRFEAPPPADFTRWLEPLGL